MIPNISSSEQYFESKRLFSLAFVIMLEKKGSDYTRDELKKMFSESTFALFPIVLTPENLNNTIMSFKSEEVQFK